MADKEVKSKLILEGEANGMVAAMERAKTAVTGMVGHMKKQSEELTHSFEGVEAVLGRVGTFMVAIAAGAGLKKLLDEAAEWNLSAMKMSLSMGTTSEEASVLMVALHGLGIENDVAVSASLRLSRALAHGTDKFDKFGITVKDSQGHLLPMPQIMSNVNEKLLATKSGADRNVIAMSLYGRGWKEMQAILRLTPEAMNEARETAERLHLMVGPKGIEQSLKYKKNLHEVGLVAESLSMQIGNALLPEIINLSSGLLDGSDRTISAFTSGLHSVEAEITRMAMLVDKFAGSVTRSMYYVTGGKFTDTGKWWADQNKIYEQRYQSSEKILTKLAMAEVGLDENGNPFAKPPPPAAGGQLDLNTVNASRASDHAASRAKYLEYEKAFEDRRVGIVKLAAAASLEANRQEYGQGLTDFRTYLKKKQVLTEEGLQADITAKKNALIAAQAAVTHAASSEVKDRKGNRDTGKEESNRYDAWKKEEEAQRALAEAEAKLAMERQKAREETRKATDEAVHGYTLVSIALLKNTGHVIEAEKAKQAMEAESVERKKLVASAKAGDTRAAIALDQITIRNKNILLKLENDLELSKLKQLKTTAEINGQMLVARDTEIKILEAEIKGAALAGKKEDIPAIQARIRKTQQTTPDAITKYDQLHEQLNASKDPHAQKLQRLKKYYEDEQKIITDAGIARGKITAQMDADSKASHQQYVDAIEEMNTKERNQNISSLTNSVGQVANIMMKGNKDQFEAGKALAIATATVQMFSAEMAAFAGITSSTGGWGIAAAAAEMAVVGVTGLANIANIESTQYRGARAMGGPVDPRSTYLVGERGPELLRMGNLGGFITPNHALPGNTRNVTVVYQISPGVADTVRAEIARMMPEITNHTVSAVHRAINSGGALSAAVGRM